MFSAYPKPILKPTQPSMVLPTVTHDDLDVIANPTKRMIAGETQHFSISSTGFPQPLQPQKSQTQISNLPNVTHNDLDIIANPSKRIIPGELKSQTTTSEPHLQGLSGLSASQDFMPGFTMSNASEKKVNFNNLAQVHEYAVDIDEFKAMHGTREEEKEDIDFVDEQNAASTGSFEQDNRERNEQEREREKDRIQEYERNRQEKEKEKERERERERKSSSSLFTDPFSPPPPFGKNSYRSHRPTSKQGMPTFMSPMTQERVPMGLDSRHYHHIKERAMYLSKLERRERHTGRSLGVDEASSLEKLVEIYLKDKFTQDAEQGVLILRRLILFVVKMAENISKDAEFLGNLQGWSQQVYMTLENYDECLYEIYDEYLAGGHHNPLWKLGIQLISHGIMYSMTNELMKHPEFQNIFKSPDFAQNIKAAFNGTDLSNVFQSLFGNNQTQQASQQTQACRNDQANHQQQTRRHTQQAANQNQNNRPQLSGNRPTMTRETQDTNQNIEDEEYVDEIEPVFTFKEQQKSKMKPPSEQTTMELMKLMRMTEIIERGQQNNPTESPNALSSSNQFQPKMQSTQPNDDHVSQSSQVPSVRQPPKIIEFTSTGATRKGTATVSFDSLQ